VLDLGFDGERTSQVSLLIALFLNVCFQLNVAVLDDSQVLVTDYRGVLELYRSNGGTWEMLAAFPFSAIAHLAGVDVSIVNWLSLNQMLMVIRVFLLERKRLQVRCLHVGQSVRCAWVGWCMLSRCCACVRSLSSVELCDVLIECVVQSMMTENSLILTIGLLGLIHILTCVWFYMGDFDETGWYKLYFKELQLDAEAEAALASPTAASTAPPEAILDYAFEKNPRVRVALRISGLCCRRCVEAVMVCLCTE